MAVCLHLGPVKNLSRSAVLLLRIVQYVLTLSVSFSSSGCICILGLPVVVEQLEGSQAAASPAYSSASAHLHTLEITRATLEVQTHFPNHHAALMPGPGSVMPVVMFFSRTSQHAGEKIRCIL